MRTSLSFSTVLLAAVATSLFAAPLTATPTAPASVASSESADDLIRKGDIFYEKFQPTEALKYYLPAEKLDPKNVRLLVKIARQYRHLMLETASRSEKVTLANTAVAYANRARTLAPEDAEAELAVAIAYGKLLPFQSTKEQVVDSRIIKSTVEKAIALNPGNDLAWHILGRWKYNVADLNGIKRALAEAVYGKMPTAKFEEAAHCFEKAIALNPSRPMHYIELGRTYAQMGNASEARTSISKGLAMPDTEKDDAETKARGRQVLSTLK